MTAPDFYDRLAAQGFAVAAVDYPTWRERPAR
jgi:hypothetical protein